jgi:hypothetical protein
VPEKNTTDKANTLNLLMHKVIGVNEKAINR